MPRTTVTPPLLLLLAIPACMSSAPAPAASPPPPEYVVTPPGPVANDPPPPPVVAPPQPTDPPPAPMTPATPPTAPIADALAQVPSAVAANYVLSISPDRNELTIDPRPRPARRAARDISGFSARDSENGGKIITLAGGPFRNARWVQASFSEQVGPGPQQDELRRAGYKLEQRRDLLVVDGEREPGVTVFAFSADADKPGIVGICSQVTIVDFVPGNTRPIAVRKPVIYLYPRTRSEVKVQVEIAGDLIATYPKPGPDGWTVTADPDGSLLDPATGRRHRYLFWEGTSAPWTIDPARAHSVPGEDAAGFLERACGRFALSDGECGDFITYWLPALERNPHNLIEFVDPERYGRYARMRVDPKPDAVIRLFMIFRRSDAPVPVGAPELPQQRRHGFTVVEWGGADLDERPPPAR